jgi:hypothetical protein
VLAPGTASEERNLVSGLGRGERELRLAHPAGTPVQASADTLLLSTDRAQVKRLRSGADEALLRGRLLPLPGGELACGEDVRVALAGFAETIPGSAFRRSGARCTYQQASAAGVRLLELDLAREKFALTILVAGPIPELANPVSFALSLGAASGSERLRMEERPGFWS